MSLCAPEGAVPYPDERPFEPVRQLAQAHPALLSMLCTMTVTQLQWLHHFLREILLPPPDDLSMVSALLMPWLWFLDVIL